MTGDGDRPVTLGALLAQVRWELGISQLRLAQRLCAAAGQATVTRHEVSRWEREERIPTGYWLGWLAAVLDLPLAELERAAAATRRARRQVPRRRRGLDETWLRLQPGVYRKVS